MMPCSPAITFCSIVGHASFQTAGPMGPSTIDRSNLWGLAAGLVTRRGVYYGLARLRLRPASMQSRLTAPRQSQYLRPALRAGADVLTGANLTQRSRIRAGQAV